MEIAMRESDSFKGSNIQELFNQMNEIYLHIEQTQEKWRKVSPYPCPDGCGTCCVDFEPDVLEIEALYLGAWMLFHQRERAESIVQNSFVPSRKDGGCGCYLFDLENPYHCTVYGGRPLICRLFGYSGDRGNDDRIRMKFCRFLPRLEGEKNRQYSEDELIAEFGALPPVMSDSTFRAISLMPDRIQDREPLHVALPTAIGKLLMLERYSRE